MAVKKSNLNLKIQTRDEVLYEGVVNAVSSINKKGKFDVLQTHANFICLLDEKIEIREVGGGKREFAVDGGILRVVRDQVEIYVGVEQVLEPTPESRQAP